MGSISDFLENELLDHVMGVGAYTPPATVYLGLSTADPLDDASGLAEPSGNGYARQSIAFNAAASRKVENTALVTFPQASGAWGTITHWALFDAESAGNMMAHGSLAVSKTVVSGNTPSVAANEVDVEFNAGAISNYLALALLDRAFRNQAYTPPTIYIALTTASIGDADTGSTITEHSGDGYARKAHSAWSAASAGATDNTGAIEFANPSGSWGTITYAAILDALTAGNLLFYADIADQTPDDGDTVSFPDGDLDISIS